MGVLQSCGFPADSRLCHSAQAVLRMYMARHILSADQVREVKQLQRGDTAGTGNLLSGRSDARACAMIRTDFSLAHDKHWRSHTREGTADRFSSGRWRGRCRQCGCGRLSSASPAPASSWPAAALPCAAHGGRTGVCDVGRLRGLTVPLLCCSRECQLPVRCRQIRSTGRIAAHCESELNRTMPNVQPA